ncbi:DUF4255 domain-containing protein [Cellulomonas dongxiuzhuiae]|uniref:DUF4255 domain-containing protein n=1 Tax=Cellulomonas dongxiuzhuiae TaxID=2819979 RepID=A0ABX8GHX3_9CELL|nr:DUF4255 domain-containing protein [Cellulomonas dongxiuzhuiae]MBO3088038.1 DUF4255 domain-containing protein [Cellulomonas dongxiuzhuiae]MBO3094610.1 DUF4255 domain-containing protein [Cellulomonas dongxiuzhuiae]QWC15624.1 DUF4255 domain-containing protein [Cellulomonas dongxiuzhuiae]
MLIPAVQDGLERLLRASLPLPTEQGDVVFDAPTSTWSATVNRLTVNLFLYDVARSGQPARMDAPVRHTDGTVVRRRFPLPMVELSFLVSAWAGSTRDEHQLLGDVLTRLLAHPTVPAEHAPAALESSVQLAVATDERNRPRDLWTSLGGQVRASFTLVTTVAADAYPWRDAPTAVAGVETRLSRRMPEHR